jgi:hypothetical protein
MSDAFDKADFYDCRGSETLTHESPEEALADYVNAFLSPGCDTAAVIREIAPVQVSAYERGAISKKDIENWAAFALEHVREHFADSYGDPDGADGIDDGAAEAAKPLMVTAIEKLVEGAQVWSCDNIAQRTYDAAEVEALVREHCPEWFEP